MTISEAKPARVIMVRPGPVDPFGGDHPYCEARIIEAVRILVEHNPSLCGAGTDHLSSLTIRSPRGVSSMAMVVIEPGTIHR